MDKTAIRDAATIIVLRDRATRPSVLMGQRGSSAAFMPNKFVFPGGAVDAVDATVPLAGTVDPRCRVNLKIDSALAPETLAAAAIRELWEETGLILGAKAAWPTPPQGWRGFGASGHMPNPSGLRFVFRAVTPAGEPRRFDARFFVVDAEQLTGDLDDFSGAEDELGHLHWVPMDEVRNLELPFITEVVLAEVRSRLPEATAPDEVPFFRNDDENRLVRWLGDKRPLG